MTKHSLARLLKPYGLRPKLLRGPEGGVFRGYEAKPIRDARERFVDTETGLDLGDDVVGF